LLAVEVSEVHAYPSRPEGFEEPLFPGDASKRVVGEHLLKAPWLRRASELERHNGEAARAFEEPVELSKTCGRLELVRLRGGRRCSWSKRRVVEVLDRWREVRGWWDEDRATDRLVFRILLSGGAVVDLSRERFGRWFIVGVVD